MIQYAIVGAGGYAAVHIRGIAQAGAGLGCRLAAAAIRPQDRTDGQVERFEAQGVKVFADAVEMFDALAGKVDAVFIPTGIATHAPLACAAMERGHNVYVEKPPAGTVQEVDQILSAQRRSGAVCALGFQAIYSTSVNRIKDLLASGALGEVLRLRCRAFWPRPDSYYARNEWAGRLRCGDAWVLDGPSNNALSHQIANMLYWASPRPRTFAAPVRVRAELYHAHDIDSEDTAGIEIATAEGPTAYFLVSHCTAGEQTGPWIEIDCSGGTVGWDAAGATTITRADGRAETFPADDRSRLEALANFTDAVGAADPERVLCTMTMGRNFAVALNGAFESSVVTRAIDPQYVRRCGEGPESTLVIDGINDAITRCAAEGKLFSDIGCPWAVPPAPFDLRGYEHFPQQFRGSE